MPILLQCLIWQEAHGSDILKIAVMPKTPLDVNRLMEVTWQMRQRSDKPLLTMAMGGLGAVTRLERRRQESSPRKSARWRTWWPATASAATPTFYCRWWPPILIATPIFAMAVVSRLPGLKEMRSMFVLKEIKGLSAWPLGGAPC
nr:Catabolic 3-dehydroquinate dehydratase [Candidatus Pantoea persica]